MDIQIDVYKNSLRLSDQQTINVIKKVRYILSKMDLSGDVITFNLGNMLKDQSNNGAVLLELKKLTNMAIHLIQIDKLIGINFYMDTLFDEEHFKNIIRLAKLSSITNKIHIKAKNIEDSVFADEFPELKVEKCEKLDIIFKKRFILDRKQEFICQEDIQGENSVIR